MRIPHNLVDIAGQKYGRLMVVRYAGPVSTGSSWVCECECGNVTTVHALKLKSGRTKSCGCYRIDFGKSRATHGGTAGGSRKPEYSTWLHIKRRCYDPADNMFQYYGARGIKVCGRWLRGEEGKEPFACFLEDMGPKPSSDHSIDRFPNCNGDYEPKNCRWATSQQQSRNRRGNNVVSLDGKDITLAEACETLGLNYGTTWDRLMKQKRPWQTIVEAARAKE